MEWGSCGGWPVYLPLVSDGCKYLMRDRWTYSAWTLGEITDIFNGDDIILVEAYRVLSVNRWFGERVGPKRNCS